MDLASLFALFVMAVLFLVIVAAIVALGSLPGQIAKTRNHPHTDAINVASWIGLAFGGILWPVALVWAFVPFSGSLSTCEGEVESLRKQVAELKTELSSLKSASA
ncbi:DUF3302 domain-containing protein [Bremerella sp.]|uniref:DUF3302 domain-containing protein n=1 Tax=Bremerella sp. TaxID=2795602 RepID=UPI00391C78E7